MDVLNFAEKYAKKEQNDDIRNMTMSQLKDELVYHQQILLSVIWFTQIPNYALKSKERINCILKILN